ncbi:MAG: hypothetical protein DRP62_06855 [Planctomycetota bacterium]|nr:MAG: hypothetical protein DRP62_06855 [Planctomycetota bacterium]
MSIMMVIPKEQLLILQPRFILFPIFLLKVLLGLLMLQGIIYRLQEEKFNQTIPLVVLKF